EQLVLLAVERLALDLRELLEDRGHVALLGIRGVDVDADVGQRVLRHEAGGPLGLVGLGPAAGTARGKDKSKAQRDEDPNNTSHGADPKPPPSARPAISGFAGCGSTRGATVVSRPCPPQDRPSTTGT